MKKKLALCFSIALLFLCTEHKAQQAGNDQLAEKYRQYKARFYQNHIRIDWGGDGIGEFSSSVPNNPAWFGHYSKAGFSLPAAAHYPTFNNYFWPTDPNTPVKKSHCNLNPELSTSNGLSTWGEDTGSYLGLYLAALSTEYALQLRANEQLAAKQTLEEIYLVLQAFRRLNMTANRWVTRYLEKVPEFKCQDAWTEDLSGYSGLTIRCDVPYYFWREFHTPSVNSHATYGPVNPIGSDDFGAIPENSLGYRCADRPNGVPDIRNVYSVSQLACQARPTCGYDEADCKFTFLAPNDSMKLAPEILAEKYFSQDQVIGFLVGLSMVVRFVPADSMHLSPHGFVSPNAMAQKIALSLVSSLDGPNDGFYTPPCIGKPEQYSGVNYCGYDWRFTKYGICEAVYQITGQRVCEGSFFNFSTLLVQGFIVGDRPILLNEKGFNEKRRMNYGFYNNLAAMSNPKQIAIANAMKDAREYAPWVEPYYPLLRKLLHNIPDSVMMEAGASVKIDYKTYPDILKKILHSYAANGNCVPTTREVNCYESGYPVAILPCDSEYLYHPNECTGHRIAEWYRYGGDFYGCGLDYMLLYNMYRLAFPED